MNVQKWFKRILLLALLLLGIFFSYRVYRRFNPVYIPTPPRPEVEITIIPGWNLRQVAEYLVLKGFASSTKDVYEVVGEPAKIQPFWVGHEPKPSVIDKTISLESSRPSEVSYEGYLAPETYRVFREATIKEVVRKMLAQRDKELSVDLINDGLQKNLYTQTPDARREFLHIVLTMASIVEKEVKHDEDRAKVADILWRRWKKNWALQVDSSVHYAVDRTGDVFTTAKERQVDSRWNTYKYPGLPPGPICNPGMESVKAAMFPEKNDYWYFLSGRDGKIYYAKTLEEHNRNKKYL